MTRSKSLLFVVLAALCVGGAPRLLAQSPGSSKAPVVLFMCPHRAAKSGPKDVDESTDTYDTIDWLIKNVPNNNGRAGLYGTSYPGFYAAAGMIDAHPALKAVSPQAPIADWWYDDFRHYGAFFLPHAFRFFSNLERLDQMPVARVDDAQLRRVFIGDIHLFAIRTDCNLLRIRS